MDGMATMKGILMLASTNRGDILDKVIRDTVYVIDNEI